MSISPLQINPDIVQILQILGGVLGGGLISVILSIINKYRSRQEVQDDHTVSINDASIKNVESAQKINDMLQELLSKEREHSEEVMKIAVEQAVREAKEECAKQIDELRTQIVALQRKLKRNQNTATRKKKQTTTSKSTTQYQ
jgi:polyhydroxyalkanoate synthesis regulator protein